jgi:hypothetical protein
MGEGTPAPTRATRKNNGETTQTLKSVDYTDTEVCATRNEADGRGRPSLQKLPGTHTQRRRVAPVIETNSPHP